MAGSAGGEEFCPVYAAIQLLQEKWALHIIRALLGGPCGFNELSRAAGGCNPATLTQRLARLEVAGVVVKTVQSYMPPRTLYTLTPAGVALQGVIDAIAAWGAAYLRADAAGGADCAGGAGSEQAARGPSGSA